MEEEVGWDPVAAPVCTGGPNAYGLEPGAANLRGGLLLGQARKFWPPLREAALKPRAQMNKQTVALIAAAMASGAHQDLAPAL